MALNPITGALPHNNLLSGFATKNSGEASVSKTDKTDQSVSNETKPQQKGKFLDHLLSRSKSDQVNPEKMMARLADLRQKGAIVRQHPLQDLVRDYLRDVRDFLGDLRDNAYEGQENADGVFQKVKVVDTKLDEIADEFINSQKPEMELVASLGELEGLLVDVFV